MEGSMKNWRFPSNRFISKTIQDTATVTTENK